MTRRHPRLALTLALTLGIAAGITPTAAQSPDRIDLPDGWQPEGITSDGTTIWVGSLANGAIWRGDVRTGEGEVFVGPAEGAVTVGVDHEATHGRLWAAGGPTGQVRVFDAGSGDLLQAYAFEAGFLNDITVTPGGAFATDSAMQQLAFIPIGPDGELAAEDQATVLPITGDLEYVDGFNANGIVSTDGWLILVQSNTGRLFRVDPASGTSFAIETEGIELTNGDGLELHGDVLYVVRNQLNTIAVLELDALLASATLLGEITSDELDVPTTVAVADDQLWAVNARFGTQPGPDVPYWVTRLPLQP